MSEFTKERPFRFWCQMTLPLVYDDSLSYYELLCKVVKYINSLMDDVAEVESTIGTLNDSFEELQEYVDNYFDDLNVSEEIDRRLDEMAASGELSELIRPIVADAAPAIITQWMEDNIEPTTPVVDESLSVSGAAADAAIVGNKLIYPIAATGITWTPGYYDADGYHGATEAGDFWLSNWVPCWEGETYTMVGRTNSETVAAIRFLNDVSGEALNMYDLGDLLEPVDVIVPPGMTSMRIATTKTGRDESYIKQKSAGVSEITKLRREVAKKTVSNSVCYVDGTDGNDSNPGTADNPLKTLGKAVTLGFTNIKAKPGVYSLPYIEDVEDFKLSAWRTKTSYSTSYGAPEKIILFKGDVLTPSVSSGEVVSNYTPQSGTYFYDVFTARTKTPTQQGEYSVVLNCAVVLYGAGVVTRQYLPVLPESYDQTPGTFTYNAGQIHITPVQGDIIDISKAKMFVVDAMAFGTRFINCGYIELDSVVTIGGFFYGFRFDHCLNAICNDCESYVTLQGSGFSVDNSNIQINNCVSNGNSVDGYGITLYGESELNNCIGCFNGDDGCSPHQETRCFVNGGNFSNNASGGVTPAFGAECNISNAIMNNNDRGLQIFYAENYPYMKTIQMNSCVCKDNTTCDVYNEHNHLIVINSIYDTIQKDSAGVNTIYTV